MAIAATRTFAEPLSELNTTPLIDVLLVLLILFVITIPPATHSLDLTLPGPPRPDVTINPVSNRVEVTADDRILWNGQPVDQAGLGGLLAATARLPREPVLEFEPEAAARYDLAAAVLRTIKLSGVTAVGFVGNERYAEFGRAAR